MKSIIFVLFVFFVALSCLAQQPSAPSGNLQQHTFTKKFIIAHAVFGASTAFDIEMTQHCIHQATCVESNPDLGTRPTRQEAYLDNFIAFGAVTGFDILIQSRHWPKYMSWIAYIGPVYGTAVHLKGGLQGIRYF